MDFVGRYERLKDSIDDLFTRLGLPTAVLEKKNVSEHAGYVDYYDDELREIVAQFYKDDLREFDYGFSPDRN